MRATSFLAQPLRLVAAGAFCMVLTGCAVVAVTSTAVSITAGAVELAADAAIGTAKIVGKGVGKAADAMLDDEPEALIDSTGAATADMSTPACTPSGC